MNSKTHQWTSGEFSLVVSPSSTRHSWAIMRSWGEWLLWELSVQFEVLRNSAGIILNRNCDGLWCWLVVVVVGSESGDDVARHSQDAARRSSLATDQVARQGRETAPVWGTRHGANAAQSWAVSPRRWWVCQPCRADDNQLPRRAEAHQRRPKIFQVFVQRSGSHFVFSLFFVVCRLCFQHLLCFGATGRLEKILRNAQVLLRKPDH